MIKIEKLFDAELKIMDIIWGNEPISAKEISVVANKKFGWNKNTTYTVIKRLIDKEIIKREEPNFICTAVIKKEEIQKTETNTLIEKLFDGSKKAFFTAFANEKLTDDEVEALKMLIEKKR